MVVLAQGAGTEFVHWKKSQLPVFLPFSPSA